MTHPIRIHPDNRSLFEFRGEPLVLLTATEHYGAVINRPFRMERYLVDAAEKKQTLTRLFVLFRELQNHINPYSTCKPESPDYIAPFERTGPGKAFDGEPKFDLDRPNPEFFERLHRFVGLASDYGIIVEVVIFSNTYAPEIWNLNPLNPKNNLNDVEEIKWAEYITCRHPKLLARQKGHARRIVEELNRYDNVIFEICNEPGGGAPGDETNPKPAEVNQWLAEMIRFVREVESKLPNRHLIVGQEAFTYAPWEQSSDLSFSELDYDVVNMHPLPNTTWHGQSYDMGTFMSKELKLRAVRDYCLATSAESKPVNLDEDNVASQYKDIDGWTIHRKRAWMTLLSGAHYDYIDFSIINYLETGTEASQRCIRSWMKYLSAFVHELDLVRARPLVGLLKRQPEHTLEAVYGVPDEEIVIYLADERELTIAGCGDPIDGSISLDLPEKTFTISCFSPVTGQESPGITVKGSAGFTFKLPRFSHDIVVRLRASHS